VTPRALRFIGISPHLSLRCRPVWGTKKRLVLFALSPRRSLPPRSSIWINSPYRRGSGVTPLADDVSVLLMDYFYYSAVSSRSRSCWAIHNPAPQIRYVLKGERGGPPGNFSRKTESSRGPALNRTCSGGRGPLGLNRA